MPSCCALTDIIDFNDYQEWTTYEEKLYSLFKQDFILTKPTFNNKKVTIRKHPTVFEKEQAFFHITSVDTKITHDLNDREPDLRRCERIHWIRPIIEIQRYMQCLNHCLKIWIEDTKGKERIHLLNEEEQFIVVLEERIDYVLLITAYYIEHKHTLKKKLKKYHQYLEKQKQKTS